MLSSAQGREYKEKKLGFWGIQNTGIFGIPKLLVMNDLEEATNYLSRIFGEESLIFRKFKEVDFKIAAGPLVTIEITFIGIDKAKALYKAILTQAIDVVKDEVFRPFEISDIPRKRNLIMWIWSAFISHPCGDSCLRL